MAVLEARNLTKTYSDGRHKVPVLRGISLSVSRGEVVAIVGPSGSGKTTLLCILGCLLTPDDRRGCDRRPGARRRVVRIGFGKSAAGRSASSSSNSTCFGSLSAAENVQYALNLKGWRGRKARAESERVLDAVGLGDRKDFRPRELSGGQRQRIAVARAIAGPSAVILADEPTGNLDSESGNRVLSLFRDLTRSEHRALLIVTHDPLVHSIADRIVTIRDGMV